MALFYDRREEFMFFFVLIGIIALVFIVSALIAIGTREAGPVVAAVFTLILGLIVTFAFSVTTVDSRAVGIQTAFGKYQDTLDNGFQLVSPWSSVEEFSTMKQDLDLKVPVSFDGGSSGTAYVTVLWAINGDEAEQLWKDWRTFDRVRDRVVRPAAATEIAAVLSSYVPNDAKNGGNRDDIQAAVKLALSGEKNNGGTLKGRGIVIDSIQVTQVELGKRAQESVDRIAEATSNTERATEEQERARVEAETARIRQESQTEETLQRYCLEVLNSWDVSKNGNAPTLLNCGLGGTAPVIVGK